MKKLCLLVFSAITLFTCTAKAQFEGYTWKVLATTSNYVPREEADFVEVDGLFYLPFVLLRGHLKVSCLNLATLAQTI